MKNTPALILLSFFLAFSAQAADVNITADNRVEWHQKSQKVVARGNAVATREDMNIKSDTLTGYYAKQAQTGKTQINRVIADGNVRMHSPRADAFGSNLDYDLEKDEAVLTGKPAKITTDKEIITAEEKITYYPSQQKAVALGNVQATDKDSNKIYSDKMTAYFIRENEKSSNLTIDKVDVFGNVKIVTPDTVVTSDKGSYYPRNGKVYLFNNVVINQQGNLLRLEKAETDINTGISKLLSSSKGKVKGVFKEKEDGQKGKDNKEQQS